MRGTIPLVPALLLIAVFLAAGCGTKEGASGGDGKAWENGGAQAPTSQDESPGDARLQGRIKVVLNTDLLWEGARHGEALQEAAGKIYDLAARHGCAVENYEFYGPYEGAVAVIALPEGKDEGEAISEFLAEPLVAHAYPAEDGD